MVLITQSYFLSVLHLTHLDMAPLESKSWVVNVYITWLKTNKLVHNYCDNDMSAIPENI